MEHSARVQPTLFSPREEAAASHSPVSSAGRLNHSLCRFCLLPWCCVQKRVMLSRSKCSLLSVPLCATVPAPTPVSQQQLLQSPSCPKPAQPRVLSNVQASAGS